MHDNRTGGSFEYCDRPVKLDINVDPKLKSNVVVKMCACSNYTSVALGNTGEVYAWGLDTDGQCGLPWQQAIDHTAQPQQRSAKSTSY